MAEIITHTPFAVSVYQIQYEHYDKDLVINAIRNYCKSNDSVHYSNHKGYQSPHTLQTVPELQSLMHFFAESCDSVLKQIGSYNYSNILLDSVWANINSGKDTYNQVHNHYGVLSGVFYAQAPEGSGKLNIMNPGMNCLWPGHFKSIERNQNTAEVAFITPTEGTLYLWPSYLNHSVNNNDKDIERISVAFNADIE